MTFPNADTEGKDISLLLPFFFFPIAWPLNISSNIKYTGENTLSIVAHLQRDTHHTPPTGQFDLELKGRQPECAKMISLTRIFLSFIALRSNQTDDGIACCSFSPVSQFLLRMWPISVDDELDSQDSSSGGIPSLPFRREQTLRGTSEDVEAHAKRKRVLRLITIGMN